MSLCGACSTIFTGNLAKKLNHDGWNWIILHPKGESYANAVKAGCVLCQSVSNAQHNEGIDGTEGIQSIEGSAWEPHQPAETRYMLTKVKNMGDYSGTWYELFLELEFGYSFRWTKSFIAHKECRYVPIKVESIRVDSSLAIGFSPAEHIPGAPNKHRWLCMDMKLAHTWLDRCIKEHGPRCAFAIDPSGFFPTRVIDVGSTDDQEWRMVLSSEHPDISRSRYTTLSHRWNKADLLSLTHETEARMRQGCPLSDLPSQYLEAVEITREFGIRYLWIDSLCVIQNSKEDWLRESRAMRKVYANSYINLATDTTFSPDQYQNESDYVHTVGTSWDDIPAAEFVIVDSSWWRQKIDQIPLLKRGWIQQERVLAPRILYYGLEEAFFECNVFQASQRFPRGMPSATNPKLKASGQFLKSPATWNETTTGHPGMTLDEYQQNFWTNIITRYSDCDLTYQSDKLIAVSGLAELYQEATGDQYVSGLWKKHLEATLSWSVGKPVSEVRIANHAIPSWSWASVSQKVMFIAEPTQSLITINSIPVTNTVGKLEEGFESNILVLQGVLIEMEIGPGLDFSEPQTDAKIGPSDIVMETSFDTILRFPLPKILLLPLHWVNFNFGCLLLTPTFGVGDVATAYERIGFAVFHEVYIRDAFNISDVWGEDGKMCQELQGKVQTIRLV